MKIIFFETGPWEEKALKRLSGHEVVFSAEPLTSENAGLASGSEVVSASIYSDLRAGVLEKLGRLGLVAVRSAGYDNVDVDYCLRRGIVVSRIPEYGGNTVAEFTLALMLAASRKVVRAAARAREGDFSLEGLNGFDLAGRVLGVIGTGRIGRQVIKYAGCIGMEAVAFSRTRYADLEKELGFRYTGFRELLSLSDIISLHVPATSQTRGMLSDDQFAAMKKGVVLVNTSRGEIVDTKALLRALESGKVSAAALDVLPREKTLRSETELLRAACEGCEDPEGLLAAQALLRHRNVIATPHIAFFTDEAIRRALEVTIENITSFIKGKPINSVTRAA
ncbi:MAG: hydroxyacid dehydrogenase [Deltaproteobacteria bacterium]|nr:hydroxyacid dehydrogenase [Deltaproteobacteria bacterium]MBZ0219952.1 hydroxyacid dehydrogenase [Deltaproteobacteria bacterium]